MNRKLVRVIFAAIALSAAAFAETWEINGERFEVKKVVTVTDSRITVLHKGGMKQFLLQDLTTELQSRFQFDERKAAEAEFSLAQKRETTNAKAAERQMLTRQNAIREAALKEQRAKIRKMQQTKARTRQGTNTTGKEPGVKHLIKGLKNKSQSDIVLQLGDPTTEFAYKNQKTKRLYYRDYWYDRSAGMERDLYIFLSREGFGSYKATTWGFYKNRRLMRFPLSEE